MPKKALMLQCVTAFAYAVFGFQKGATVRHRANKKHTRIRCAVFES